MCIFHILDLGRCIGFVVLTTSSIFCKCFKTVFIRIFQYGFAVGLKGVYGNSEIKF